MNESVNWRCGWTWNCTMYMIIVKSSHYYLYAFNNANCVKAALHQLDIKLGGFTSALQYLDGEIMCRNGVILLWPDEISSLNLGCSRVRLYVSMCNYRLYHCVCYFECIIKRKKFQGLLQPVTVPVYWRLVPGAEVLGVVLGKHPPLYVRMFEQKRKI